MHVYFLLSVMFLKRKTKQRDVGQWIYVLSLVFGCSTEKCKNSILKQEKVFYLFILGVIIFGSVQFSLEKINQIKIIII